MNYENNLINVDSLANIIENKKFQCIEYFNINEIISFGIKIYLGEKKNRIVIKLFDTTIIKYDKKNINDDKFNPLNIKNNFFKLKKCKRKTFDSSGIKNFFIDKPKCSSKINILQYLNKWQFKNIYNNYFCFCKGSCLYEKIPELCKYHFYLYIIDNNKYLYIPFIYSLKIYYGL